jgi:hypothetical protein
MSNRTMALPLTLVMAALLSAAPAMAQGNSQNRGNAPRAELREDREDRDDRDRDRPRLDRRQDKRQDGRQDARRNTRQVPPGWCIGRGNPHNTPENCGYARDRRDTDRDRVYDRNRTVDRRAGTSYEQRHADFHRRHDAECRERARRAGLRPAELLRVRTECAREHDDWHRREGTRHR